MLDERVIDVALRALSSELERQGTPYEIVVLGGASLAARQLTNRATADVDVLGLRLPDGTVKTAAPLPEPLERAAHTVATALDLPTDWLDDRPGLDFTNAAPGGFEERMERHDFGALVVWHLSRRDILMIKIIAAAERWGEPAEKHWADVKALKPTERDIDDARAFAARVWTHSSAAWGALDEITRKLRDG